MLPTPQSSVGPGVPIEFTFAPLIEISAEGAYVFGKINDVSSNVLHSVQQQLRVLEQRKHDGKAPCPPIPNTRAKGCLWVWMHKATGRHRWTLDAPSKYTCATCFNARRACLLYFGEMKWMILPLPPAARTDESWEDAGYYVHQGIKESDKYFPGTWEQSRRAMGS